MQSRDLASLVALAEHLHFGHAAMAEHISVSTLSRRIVALERDTGLVLAIRSTHAVELTEQGKAFLPIAVRLLAEVATAKRAAREIRAGRGRDAQRPALDVPYGRSIPET